MPESLMPESLVDLEAERAKLLQQFVSLSDFRPGSITASVRRCGKPTCHCAKPNDPGHDPQFRLSRKVNGKSVNESFATPAALRKAQREVAEFQRWQQLGQQLVTINQKICTLRAVREEGSGWTPQEKKGCCDPSRDHAGNKPPAGSPLCRTAQDRGDGFGSHRTGPAGEPASGRGHSLNRIAAVRSALRGTAATTLLLRPHRSLC